MSYKSGDKIFTKVKGFRHWPCRINPLPKEVVVPSGKYPIFFYGSHEVMFLSGKDIFPFESNLEKWGKKPGPPQFNLGMNEIINNPTLFQYGIDPDAESFLAQFYDFPFIGASDAVTAPAKEPAVIPQIEPKSTRKRSKNSSNKTASKLPKMSTEVSSGHKSQIKTADSHENANMDQSSGSRMNGLTEDVDELDETSSDDSRDDDFVPVKKKRTSGSSGGKTRSGPKKKKAPPKSRESVSEIRRWEAASDVSSLSSEEDVPLVKLTGASNASEERSVSSSLHLPTEMNSEGLQSAASVEPAKSISPDLPLLFTEEKTPLDQPQEPLVEIVPEKHPNQPEVSQPSSDAILTNSSSRNVGENRRKSKQKKLKQKKEKKKRPVIPSDSESDTDSPRKVSEDPVHHPELPPASEAVVTSNTPLATEDADNNSRTVQDSSEHKSSTSTHKKNSNTTKPNNSVPVKVKSHSTSIESRLRMVDATIKRCLIRGSEDFPRCLSVMKELNDLPIRLSDLAKCCELMATLKKCRKYRLNDEIKSMAQHVYNRFLEIPTDATHEEVSMASRCIQQQQKVVESTRQTKAMETIVSTSMSPVLVSKKEDIPLLEELKVDTTTMPEKQLLPVSIVSQEVYVVDLDSDKSTEVVPVAPAPIAAAANNDEDDERSFAELLKNIPGFELATSTLGFCETSVMETGDSGGLLFPPSTTSVSLPSASKEGSLKRLLQPGNHPVAQPVATEWPTENLVRERKEKHKFHRNHRRLGSSNSSRSSSSSSSSRSSSSSNSSRSSRSSLATPDVEPTTLTSNGSHAMHEPSTGPITGAPVTSSVLDLDSRIQQLIQAGTGAPPHPPPPPLSNTSSRHRASNNSIQVAHSRPYSIISKLPLPPGVTKRDLLPPPSTNVNTNTPLGPLFPTSGIDAPSTAHHTASHNNRTTVNDEDIYNLLGV